MDNAIMENLFEKEIIDTKTETEYVTYGELTKKVGTMTFCEEMDRRYRNYISMRDKNMQGLSQEEINLLVNVYHWYIITKEAAEFLQKETDEVVYYDQELNVYAWGIVTGDSDTDWRNAESTVMRKKGCYAQDMCCGYGGWNS